MCYSYFMKKYDALLFDLDGTLTESGIGITRCAAYALDTLGLTRPSTDKLNVFVGPPLRETFPKFGVKEEDIDKAITIFRSRYTTIGKFENDPYQGIVELLQHLKQKGYRLFVATSKPEGVAKEILEHFQLTQYFDVIAGASLDASRENKSAVIAYLLASQNVHAPLMIGDTEYDVIGATEHNIPCIGVSWGYGTKESMLQAGAIDVVDTMQQLEQAIDGNA